MLHTAELERYTRADVPKEKTPPFPFPSYFGSGIYSPQFTYQHIGQNVGTAWAAIELRANQIALMKKLAYKTDAGGAVTDTPVDYLNKLLANPQPHPQGKTPIGFWKQIYKWRFFTGSSYCLVQRDPSTDLPIALWDLETNNLTILPATEETQILGGYRYTTPRGVYNFRPEDIWVWRHHEPNINFIYNLYYGIPEVAASSNVIDTETQALTFFDASFANNQRPDFLFKTPLDEDADNAGAWIAMVTKFKQDWEEKFLGAGNAGKPAAMPPGWEVEILQSKLQATNNVELLESLRTFIGTSMGTPRRMLDSDFNAISTAEITRESFIKDKIYPEAQDLCDSLTKQFLQDEVDIQVTFADLFHTPSDTKALIVKTLKEANAITPNEARQIMDNILPDMDNGIGKKMLVPNTLVDVDSVLSGATLPQNKPTEPEEPPEPPKKKVYKSLDEERKALYKSKDALAQWHAKKLAGNLSSVYGKLGMEIGSKIRREKADDAPMTDAERDKLLDSVTIDMSKYTDLMMDAAGDPLDDAAKAAIKHALAEIDFTGDVRPDEIAEKVVSDLTDKIATLPLEDVQDQLNTIIHDGFRKELSVDDVAKNIMQRLGNIKEWKAKQVAQTTMTPVVNGAQHEAWMRTGVVKRKELLSMRDGDVRESHAEADGQQRDLDKEFDLPAAGKCGAAKTMYPGKSGVACQDINCRCYERAVK